MDLSSTSFIYILCILIIIVLLSSLYPNNVFLTTFVNRSVVISSILVCMGIYITFLIFRKQEDISITDQTFKAIDRLELLLFQRFVEYYDKCPNFINSLHFSWQASVLKIPAVVENPSTKDDPIAVQYLSMLIFQSCEDFLQVSHTTASEDGEYVGMYLGFFQSKQLITNWSVLKQIFMADTIKFVDILINIVNNNTFTNAEELQKYIANFQHTPEWKPIGDILRKEVIVKH